MAKFALEIVYPRDDLDTANRCYHAYPGLTYEIGVSVFGGLYPFVYTLSGEPSGMTINASTGVITWVNPQSSSGTITVTVTDDEDTVDTETFTVAVATTNFKFVDAVGGSDSNNGSSAALAKQTVSALSAVDAGSTIWYFRTGVYNLNGIGTTGPVEAPYVDFEYDAGGGGNSTQWLAYPGETPAFDFQYVASAVPFIRFSGPNIFIDGFECYGDFVKCFEGNGAATNSQPIFRNLHCHTGGPGLGGSNAAFIMVGHSALKYGLTIQDCVFDDAAHNALKIYDVTKHVVERCTFSHNGGIEEKDGCVQFSIRACEFHDIDNDGTGAGVAFGGNLNNGAGTSTGEVCFNLFEGSADYEIEIGRAEVNPIGAMYVYRNTIVGDIHLEDVDTADGPYTFENNVIINAQGAQSPWPFVVETSITDTSRVTINISSNPELSPTGVENLAGATSDNIVDASWLLQGTYRTNFLGLKGHEVVAVSQGYTGKAGFIRWAF